VEQKAIVGRGLTAEQINSVPLGAARSSEGPSRPRFVSSLLAIAGGQLGCVAIAALAELCYARLLGPAPRGLISLCLMSIAFGAMLGSLGSEATVILWISRSKGNHSSWFPAVILWVVTGCVVSVSFWIGLYWRVRPAFLKGLTPGLAHLVLWTIPATVLFSVLMALLVGEERFRLRSIIALVNRAFCLVAFLVCIPLLGRRAESAILGNLAGLVVAVCIALAFIGHFFRGAWKIKGARQNMIPTMLFGIRGQAGNLASFFSYRLDVFVVNYYLDAAQVGLYALGVLVSEALWQLPGIVCVALFPRTARTVGAGAESFTCMILRQMFLLTMAGALVIAVASPLAIPLVFGSRFAPSVPVIWWILPGTVALALGKVMAADLAGRDMNIHLPISALIGLLFTLGLDLFLIPRMGIQGAALASSLAYLAATLYLFIVIQRALKTSWKSLVLPSLAELAAYEKLWLLLRARFWPARASAESRAR